MPKIKVTVGGKVIESTDGVKIEWEDRPLSLVFHSDGSTTATLAEDSEGESDTAALPDLVDLAENLGLAVSEDHAATLAGDLDDENDEDMEEDEEDDEQAEAA